MTRKKSSKQQEPITNSQPQLRKQFHQKDLIKYQPITKTQEKLFETFEEFPNKSMFLYGSPGTGKTFLATYLALQQILDNTTGFDKILYIRNPVQTGENIGFTPGTPEEKISLYEQPYASIFEEMFGWENSWQNCKKLGIVEFCIPNFLRGTTFKNTIVIVDECQSMSFHTINTIVTRIGQDSKIILCGDESQNDLIGNKYKNYEISSGFNKTLNIVKKITQHFSIIEFKTNDVIRSELVKDWIINSE